MQPGAKLLEQTNTAAVRICVVREHLVAPLVPAELGKTRA
jgi:hypothetical protein